MIIGAPKTLDDMPVFSRQEVMDYIRGCHHLAGEQIPPEVPGSLPIEHILRLGSTLKAYHRLLTALSEMPVPKTEEEVAKFQELVTGAGVLLHISYNVSPIIAPK